MSGEAGDAPGLDPAVDRTPVGRLPWGRRSSGQSEAGFAGDRGGPTYAALDLGTNNCRLLVARPAATASASSMRSPALSGWGRAVTASGRLSDVAIRAGAVGLGDLPQQDAQPWCHPRPADRDRSLPRGGENGDEFLARVAKEIGISLEIIDRETEATLAATGCTPLMDPHADGVVLFDIGGGSSELVRLDRSANMRRGPPLPQICGWISLPHGVVTLAERHGGST